MTHSVPKPRMLSVRTRRPRSTKRFSVFISFGRASTAAPSPAGISPAISSMRGWKYSVVTSVWFLASRTSSRTRRERPDLVFRSATRMMSS